jgi:hypothetical protein
MPNTTNYNWVTPADSDLVKDGAAAIRTLGSSIDSTLKTQIDAQIPDALLTTKGDLIAATGASTPARLAVGTNGQVLTADSAASTGVAWSTIGGGQTLIASQTFNNTTGTYSFSSLAQTYKHLLIIGHGFQSNDSTGRFTWWRLNGDSGSNYTGSGSLDGGTEWKSSASDLSVTSATNPQLGQWNIFFPNYTSAFTKTGIFTKYSNAGTTGSTYGVWNNTAAITAISITTNIAQFKAGTIYIYGVN